VVHLQGNKKTCLCDDSYYTLSSLSKKLWSGDSKGLALEADITFIFTLALRYYPGA